MPRKILHLDLDAFFCAVEEQRDPALCGRPFAVGGQPDQRGVVASCSYAARQFGIRSAMPMARAVRLCPGLIIVPAHFPAYRAASRQVMATLHTLTPLVEQLSIDEAFLDVSDLPEPGEVIARRLQASINTQLKLPCSLGVATNKLVAKIANNLGKASARGSQPPNTIKVVPPGQEAAFLSPLPVAELWGVGPKTADRLAQLGIRTIGELARWPAADLARRFGQPGRDLARHARGLDERPVETEHETRSISQEITFAEDIADGEQLRQTLRHQSEQVGRRLRQHKLQGSTVRLKLRWADFTTLTRQLTLARPTDLDGEIYAAARQLFEQTWPPGRRVRLIGVGVSGFETPGYQLGLWETETEPNRTGGCKPPWMTCGGGLATRRSSGVTVCSPTPMINLRPGPLELPANVPGQRRRLPLTPPILSAIPNSNNGSIGKTRRCQEHLGQLTLSGHRSLRTSV